MVIIRIYVSFLINSVPVCAPFGVIANGMAASTESSFINGGTLAISCLENFRLQEEEDEVTCEDAEDGQSATWSSTTDDFTCGKFKSLPVFIILVILHYHDI